MNKAPLATPFEADPPVENQQSLAEILETAGRLSHESVKRACAMAQETGQDLGFVVTQLGLLSERALADLYGKALGAFPVKNDEYPTAPLAVDGLSIKFLRRIHAIPIERNQNELIVAMVNPLDETAIKAMAFSTELEIVSRPALLGELDAALARLFPEAVPTADMADVFGDADKNDVMRLQDVASGAPVIRFVDRLIAEAVEKRASDIHLEAARTGLRVRLRIDGVLQEHDRPFSSWGSAIISRVKLLAGLNIAEHRLAQDGRIRTTVRGHEIDLRVATTPTINGESVTLRILDRGQVSLNFDDLGFDGETLEAYLKILDNPAGMVLVTGPTGSGKTTTLYSSLNHLNVPERKIITIEDPIEYLLEGINQVQVKPSIGLTFANALRSFLRLDPDILLVGEIRDLETAEVAIQASLTGHRVLSTLHTNDASTGVTRLLDMGVAEYLISSTVTAILAQRLVRTLCPKCRRENKASRDLVDQYDLGRFSEKESISLWQASGCAECNHTGYRGRSVILELLPISDAIRKLILKRAEAKEILSTARKEGMRTMLEHGLVKVIEGTTTIDEVLRVVGNG